MTGNESDASKDPNETVFDPDDIFGSDTGESSTDSGRDPDNIWGPFTGDVSPDHSTQVLESDAFGRPFLSGDSGDPFGSTDPGTGDMNLWDRPAGEATGSDENAGAPWDPPAFGGGQPEPPAHMEHEVPPPWEVEGGAPTPWSPPPAPEGQQDQPWQPTPENGQQPWQPPQQQEPPQQPQQPATEFDPFNPGQQAENPWAQPGPSADSPFGAFGAPEQSGEQSGGIPSFDSPQPGAEVPNPFAADLGPVDAAPSPFDSAPADGGPFGQDADQPTDEPPTQFESSPFWPSDSGQQGDDDEHSTDVLAKPSGEEPAPFEPWSPHPPEPGQPPSGPWGPWPADAGQQAPPQQPPPPPPPQQQAPPRYDLSQFQQGYQPPQAQPGQQPPQAQPGPPAPPQEGPGQQFPGAPPGQDPFQQFPGMAPPLQMPPQQPIPLTSENLSPQALLKPRKAAPSSGWRRALFKASGGLIDPGESSKEIQRQQMVSLVRTPVAGGHYRVAVLSLKGGVGKTTTTVGLGSTLASLRGDRIIAVDANPDRGTLSEKVRLETRANVRDLLGNKENIERYSDVRQYTSQAASRLEVLASDPDPAISEAFSEDDYRSIADVLEHYYSICLTDCGTGLLHSAMRGVLGLADQIVLVSSASVDGARSASATLDWLDAHEYGDLVQSGVVVMSAVRPQNKAVDLSRLEQHFSARCRALVRIPFDPHLEAGAEFVLEQLSAPTRDAYLELTAAVAAGFQYRLPR